MANKSFPTGPDDSGAAAPDTGIGKHPLKPFRTVMSSFIDDFFTSFDLLPLIVFEDAGAFMPRFSIARDRHGVTIIAELPGMEASDLEITLGANSLLIQGQKKQSGAGFTPDDFHAPFFRRMIPIPFSIDAQKARATFEDQVLRVMLPRRTGDSPARIRIPIRD